MIRRARRPDWLVVVVLAAALAAELAAIGLSTTASGQTKGPSVAISLFIYWRIWRGGHIARGIAVFLALFGCALFAASLVSDGRVAWAWLQCLLYGVEAVLLLSAPVWRHVGNAESQRELSTQPQL